MTTPQSPYIRIMNGVEVEINMDEANVPDYVLPPLLTCADGSQVTSSADWEQRRRPEIVALYNNEVYGCAPDSSPPITFQVLEQDDQALEGQASRKQIRIFLLGQADGPWLDLLLYLPNNGQQASPLFIGLNFVGNHTIQPDPQIRLTDHWVPSFPNSKTEQNRATEQSRGTSASRWPLELILARGYGLATIYSGDLDLDFDDGFQNGIQPHFYRPGQSRPAAAEWGTLAAWAWGLSRAIDYLEQDAQVDAARITLVGHSRMGKAAVWAGALDTRFAAVISNDSGCGGAALSRRRFGETVKAINTQFPHWFCDNFKKYSDNEDALPLDQHMLLALVAPRPLYVASASEDLWADPKGEFLAARAVSPVYQLYGLEGLTAAELPEADTPLSGPVSYHLRSGKHDLTAYDWQQYLDFADRYLK